MQFNNPTSSAAFEVRPSIITGDTADFYLHRTQRILRNEGMNPTVVMEFSPSQQAVLCGSQEVKAVLEKVTSEGNRQIWAVEEGTEIAQNEVCLQVRAPYTSFGLYETAICGMLAHQSGWATAARTIARAAQGIPVISVGAHNVHPSVAAVMDYAAIVGGCASGSTVLGSRLAASTPVSSVSGALVQLIGDPVKAMLAFDRAVSPEAQRMAYVDPRYDVVEQVAALARATGDRLNSVRLSRRPGGSQIPPADIQQVRERLNKVGAQQVQIILSGRMTPERVAELVEANAPVDALHDTSYIASSPPIAFSPNIRSINDREIAQETEPPPPNPRLMRLL